MEYSMFYRKCHEIKRFLIEYFCRYICISFKNLLFSSLKEYCIRLCSKKIGSFGICNELIFFDRFGAMIFLNELIISIKRQILSEIVCTGKKNIFLHRSIRIEEQISRRKMHTDALCINSEYEIEPDFFNRVSVQFFSYLCCNNCFQLSNTL